MGYEYEDVDILEPPKERRPTTEPPAEGPITGEDFAEIATIESTVPAEIALGDMPSSKVDSPTIDVSSAETVVDEATSHKETASATTISTGVTTTDTSAHSGNDCKNLTINFSYAFFLIPEPLQEPYH